MRNQRLVSGLLGVVVGAAAFAAEKRPTSAAMRKAFEQNQRAVVEVKGSRRGGTGVIVGADGHVVTSVELVSLRTATVRFEGEDLPAQVVMADARLGIAVVKLEGEQLPAAAVRVVEQLPRGAWLIGIARGRKGARPSLGQVTRARAPFVETDLMLPPGAPLFDAKGRLVAVAVAQRGPAGVRALPISAVKAQLAQTRALEAEAPVVPASGDEE